MKTSHIITLVSRIRDKANKLIVSELEKSGIKGIAPSHGSIFVALYKHTHLSMKQVADFIHKDKSTVTALIDKLESLGYVKRCGHETCNRTTMIELTPKGKKLEHIITKISQTLLDSVYNGFKETEKDSLIGYLERVDKNL
jgi:DNA-binding MarR family transcriptional regulator